MKYRTGHLIGLLASAALLAGCSSPEERVERFYESGVEYLDEGDYGRANVQFQNVLKINDQHVPTLMALARSAEERGEFKALFGILQTVVRLDENNTDAIGKLAKLQLIADDETEALAMAERLLALDPTNIDGLTTKSAVFLRVGNREEAVKIANDVLARAPANAEASTVIATARVMQDDIEGAIDELDRVLELTPRSAVLQLLRIQFLSQLEREEDVLDGYARLTQLFPEEPVYRRTYASALLAREDYDGALAQLRAVVDVLPDSNNAKLDLVRVINAGSGADAAEAQLRAFADANPDNTELQFALSDFLLQHGERQAAFDIVEALFDSENRTAALEAKNRMSAFALRDGRRERAEALVDEILEEDEANVGGLTRRAQMQILDGDADAAVANLRTALNNNPDAYEAMIVMAGAFETQGNRDFARSELAKAFEASQEDPKVANLFARFLFSEGNPVRAADVLEESLARHPRDRANLKLLAEARLQNQDWRGAEEVANILDNLGEDDDSAALNIRSVALSGLEEYDEVIELVNKGASSEPLSATPLAALTRAYLSQQRYAEARDTLEGVIESDADNYEAHILLAQTVEAAGDREALETALLRASEVAPSRPEAHISLYRVYMSLGQRADAFAAINRGLENAPNSNALKVYKADMLLAQNDLDGALTLYEELLPSFGENRIVVNNFISLLNKLRPDPVNSQRALQYVGVIENDTNPSLKDTAGWAYFLAGDAEKAVGHLDAAVEGAPDNPEILYHAGAAKIAIGDTEAGVSLLERSLAAAGADFDYADDVRSLLEENRAQ
ncbi:MAG: tetratricopeptide repeat protein [Pseudomonadota bacterium]